MKWHRFLLIGGMLPGLFTMELKAQDKPFPIGFTLRNNTFFKDWLPSGERFDVDFDTFWLRHDWGWRNWVWSGQYRFYEGYSFVHHGWLGYNFSTHSQLQVGIQQVPFGIQPYASHNYFFQLPYYLGLEDDYDLGVKWLYHPEPWHLTLGYYPMAEPAGFGRSIDSTRYSYDLVDSRKELADPSNPTSFLDHRNVERHQFNARLAYTFNPGSPFSTEIGSSSQVGQIHNRATDRDGWQWASGVHLNGNYRRWNVQLQAMRYEYHPENSSDQDSRWVVMGAYDAPYLVAARANVYGVGVSYTLPVQWGPITGVTFYNDYSFLQKDGAGLFDTQQNVVGMLITMPKTYIYLDVASGRNHPWLGPDYNTGLGPGRPNAEWQTRINLNFGVYF